MLLRVRLLRSRPLAEGAGEALDSGVHVHVDLDARRRDAPRDGHARAGGGMGIMGYIKKLDKKLNRQHLKIK